MNEKKRFHILVAGLVTVITLLLVIIVLLMIRLIKGPKPVAAPPQTTLTPDTPTDLPVPDTPGKEDPDTPDAPGKEEPDTPQDPAKEEPDTPTVPTVSTDAGTPLVTKGFQFMIPKECDVLFSDEIGIIIAMPDVFQMKIAIIEEDNARFDEFRADPSILTEKALAAGAIMTTDAKANTVDGIEILNFRIDLLGDDTAVFRVRLDDGHSFAGQMAIFSPTLTETDYLNVVALLLKNVSATTADDTTADEYYALAYRQDVGEQVESMTITTDTFALTYKVPPIFFASGETYVSDAKWYYSDSLLTNDFDIIDVTVEVYESGAYNFLFYNGYFDGCTIETITRGNRTFYLVESRKTEDGVEWQRLDIATDTGFGDWIYFIDLYTEHLYTLEDLEAFLDITIEAR